MEYLIVFELACILAVLLFIVRKKKFKILSTPAPEIQQTPIKPFSPPSERVEIVKLRGDGTVDYKIRDEFLDHPDIAKVWETEELGIRHPDGRIQLYSEDK